MPFISNGSEWKLIDDEEPYDKKRYVVVKTLHVKLNTTDTALPIQEFSIDQIRQHTRKFGQIESIEMLPDNSALVSFATDRTAHSMQLQHDFDKETGKKQPFQVRPADTFEQPQSKTNLPPKKIIKVDEQTSKMCMLNEDCLLHLFKFLDLKSLVNMADVCKMFNGLLHKYSFPHIKKYEFKHDIFDTRKFNPTLLPKLLERMRRTLHCVGRHITDLTIEVGNKTSEWISAHDSAGGFWGILAEYVGTNLRQAYWQIGESHLSLLEREEEIAKIAPILRHLEHLRIEADSMNEYIIDFQTLCPNLVEFELSAPVKLPNCDRPWRSLRCLDTQFCCVHGNERTLPSYYQWNPQLTCVAFRTTEVFPVRGILSAVANLSLLDKVHIGWYGYYPVGGHDITCLKNLQHLTEIELWGVNHRCLEGNSDCLATFVGLQKILLDCDADHGTANERSFGQSFFKLAKLPHLEVFELYTARIPKANLVKFVRFASQLKTLELCNHKNSPKINFELLLVNVSEPKPQNLSRLQEFRSPEFDNYYVFGTKAVLRYLRRTSKK